MAAPAAEVETLETLRTLPGDDVRQIMWRFADRYDLQMLVQSVARGGARAGGPAGGRGRRATRTSGPPEKDALLEHFDEAGITGRLPGPGAGRLHRGPEEPGAGAGRLRAGLGGRRRGHLQPGRPPRARAHPRARHARAARPLHEPAPRPPQPGEDRKPWRGAFCLTEPIPYVGVETGHARRQGARGGVEGGRGADPPGRQARPLHHQHGLRQLRHRRRRLGDPRIKGSCMVILEEGDPGTFDRGTPTTQAGAPALLHPRPGLQPDACRPAASSAATRSRTASSSRSYSHGEVIEAVFRRTRVTVGPDDVGEAALGRRAGHPLPARPLPRRRRGAARLAALRTRPAAEGGRAAPAGRHLGHRRGQRVARLRRGAPLRRARSAREGEGPTSSPTQGISGARRS